MYLPDMLRVALLAGTLGQGGAEKQLVYLARTLVAAGVETRVYSLTRGEFYAQVLEEVGLQPVWVGRFASPVGRLATMVGRMRQFRPHIIQSGHSFTNLYAGILGRVLGVVSIGAVRSSVGHTRAANGRWTRWLLGATDGLFVNSQRAYGELIEKDLVEPGRACLVPNVIELRAGRSPDQTAPGRGDDGSPRCRVVFVGRLVPAKRLDRFIQALAIACRQEPALQGVVIGEGCCREPMERLAAEIGLGPANVEFLRRRDDVSGLLAAADMLVLCSDHEGFPNVLLEGMAAGLPVITTPAGDAGAIVQHGVTGYVVQFDDVQGIAEHMVRLARSPEMRRQLGRAGQERVKEHHSLERLPGRVLSAYRSIAEQQGSRELLNVLQAVPGAP